MFVLNTASEVLMTEGSADDVKKTFQDLVGLFEAFPSWKCQDQLGR